MISITIANEIMIDSQRFVSLREREQRKNLRVSVRHGDSMTTDGAERREDSTR